MTTPAILSSTIEGSDSSLSPISPFKLLSVLVKADTVGERPLALTYDGSGNLTQLDKTIGAVTYRKTFTWDTGRLTAISTWSQV